MTPNSNLERRLADHYASEPPLRAPDRVLLSTLATIDTTRQRRGLLAPWRFPQMNTYTRLAAAAVAAVAIGAVALWLVGPSGPGGPRTTATPTASPTAPSAPVPSPYVPPALTETFTSNIHGISISYPAGWVTQKATTPWTTPNDPGYLQTFGDFMYDPARTDHLFLMLASQPLKSSFAEWAASGLTGDCATSEPIVVDGAEGVLATGCSFAYVPSGGRVYIVRLYHSNDEAELVFLDADAWLRDILATVQLQPEDAIDAAPTASP